MNRMARAADFISSIFSMRYCSYFRIQAKWTGGVEVRILFVCTGIPRQSQWRKLYLMIWCKSRVERLKADSAGIAFIRPESQQDRPA